jgi:hypothetical protein
MLTSFGFKGLNIKRNGKGRQNSEKRDEEMKRGKKMMK